MHFVNAILAKVIVLQGREYHHLNGNQVYEHCGSKNHITRDQYVNTSMKEREMRSDVRGVHRRCCFAVGHVEKEF